MSRTFITYAHRGASAYCPENTFLSFYTGLFMGANGIETDVQLTADGVPVLFHDDTLHRVMGIDGRLSQYTYQELCQFPIKANGYTDYIPTLDDFLQKFGKQNLTLAIELKGENTEELTARLIQKHQLEHKCVITSFRFDYLLKIHALSPELRLGFLAFPGQVTQELLQTMQSTGFYEICPHAEDVTLENVAYWHSLGLNVRAWGVCDEQRMRKVYDNGADGATVNFPDKMLHYIHNRI